MQALMRLEANTTGAMSQPRRGGGRRKPSALKHMENEDLTTHSVAVARVWHDAYDELVRMEEQLLNQLEQMLPKPSKAALPEAQLTNLPIINEHLQTFKSQRCPPPRHAQAPPCI